MLDSIRAALKEKGLWDAALESHFAEFERLAIAEIRSDALRHAVLDYLENTAPLQFFFAPASSSGKNHPAWQAKAGGILLNTSECCVGIDRKLRMYPNLTDATFNPLLNDRDIVYVATIISDTFKPLDAGKHWREFAHHRIAAEKWRQTAQKHNLPNPQADVIADAIFWHLGRFTPEWPSGADPRDRLSLHALITHELDMDFSNRNLSLVFDRKGMGANMPASDPPDAFLKQEFDTSASYFAHIEGKLLNIVTFYLTVIMAVIAGTSYIAGAEMFARLRFWLVTGPRAFFMAIITSAFFLIGTFLLGMYTELRTRKVLMLEEMARIREYYIENSRASGRDISSPITLVTGVAKCPPYLRRPSEDWYTILLMVFVNAVSVAFAAAVTAYAFATNVFKGSSFGEALLFLIGLLLFLAASYLQFRWVTLFCFLLDCRRELKHGPSKYGLFPRYRSAFPPGLRFFDHLADSIEKAHKPAILESLRLDASSGQ